MKCLTEHPQKLFIFFYYLSKLILFHYGFVWPTQENDFSAYTCLKHYTHSKKGAVYSNHGSSSIM